MGNPNNLDKINHILRNLTGKAEGLIKEIEKECRKARKELEKLSNDSGKRH